MQYQDCERILYNILSGKKFIEVGGKTILVKSPDVDVVNESNYLYEEVLKKSLGSYNKESLNKILMDRGLFSLKDLEFIDKFPDQLKKLQKDLYYTRDNVSRNDVIREGIGILRDEYSRISNLVSTYDNYTSEGIASMTKSIFIISKTCYYKGKLVKYSKSLFDGILAKLYEKYISQTDIRYLSRNPPWTNMWIGLKNNGRIFKNGVSLSVEQQGLLMWTRIYDSLSECSEPPEKRVVSDDDMFDGWMFSREDPKGKEQANNHDEVFIIATKPEDIDKISNMNSPGSKNIQHQRLNFIYNVGTELKESSLPDVAQGLAMQSVQQEIASRRGK